MLKFGYDIDSGLHFSLWPPTSAVIKEGDCGRTNKELIKIHRVIDSGH